MESAPGAETVINGRRCLYFGGTGYFGLHGNAEMMKAGIEAFQWCTHSATTRAGFGNNPVLLDVEKKLADFFGAEEAVYFVSGYFNALFLAQALAADYDAAFIDETSHFSVRDGVRTTGKPVFAYKHRDPADLRARLETVLKAGQRPLVMTDGVFPTFGEIAPVPDLIECLKPYDGILALDDAHAVGVLGENGRGTYEHFGVSGPRLHYAGTLSKAFGGHGGFLPASSALVKRVRETVGAYAGHGIRRQGHAGSHRHLDAQDGRGNETHSSRPVGRRHRRGLSQVCRRAGGRSAEGDRVLDPYAGPYRPPAGRA
jgi:7-keto-8-aminopelargonate synthetase-like enzyme